MLSPFPPFVKHQFLPSGFVFFAEVVSFLHVETLDSMEISRQTSRQGARDRRSSGHFGPTQAFYPAFGGTRTHRAFAGRNSFPCPRPYQHESHSTQPGLGLAILGRAPVQPRRPVLHPPVIFLYPCQPDPQELDRRWTSRPPALSSRRSERSRNALARRLVH